MCRVHRQIDNLVELVQELPVAEQRRVERIFRVETTTGQLRAPAAMHDWIRQQFGSVQAVEQQRIVKVTNLITVEGALFNELRARRPQEETRPLDVEQVIARESGDLFCLPLGGTPEDVFGRVKGKHCTTASNIAKGDGFHGVVVFDRHDPLAFTSDAVGDYIDTALAWARKAHCEDKSARYFAFMWNCLWRSGASIVHGHAQMFLGRGMHYARIEHLRRCALLYRIGHGTNYFDDLCSVHRSLGLAIDYGGVCALAYLTPVREKEVLLISQRPDDDLKDAAYRVLRCFVDSLGVASFNLALWIKPIDSVPEDWSGFPAVVRIVDRGELSHRTSDVGSMELFGSSVVSGDPFELADALKAALRQRA